MSYPWGLYPRAPLGPGAGDGDGPTRGAGDPLALMSARVGIGGRTEDVTDDVIDDLSPYSPTGESEGKGAVMFL